MVEQEEIDGVWVVTTSGKATTADFDAVVPRMRQVLTSDEPLRMVVDHRRSEGMTLGGWIREFVELVRLFPLRNAAGRCAVITARNYTDGFMRVEDIFQPNLETRFFQEDERERAIEWARDAGGVRAISQAVPVERARPARLAPSRSGVVARCGHLPSSQPDPRCHSGIRLELFLKENATPTASSSTSMS